MTLESSSSTSRYRFVSWFSVVGGPTAYTCAHGLADTCDRANSSNSSSTYRQVLGLYRKRANTPCSCGHLAPSRFRYNPKTTRPETPRVLLNVARVMDEERYFFGPL